MPLSLWSSLTFWLLILVLYLGPPNLRVCSLVTTSLPMSNLSHPRKILILPNSMFATLEAYLAKTSSLLEYFLANIFPYFKLKNYRALICKMSTNRYFFSKAHLKSAQLISKTLWLSYNIYHHILAFLFRKILTY